MKPSKWQYGKDPNPKSWHDAAQIIKTNTPKKVKPRGDEPKPAKPGK